jgi:hypothetical protein
VSVRSDSVFLGPDFEVDRSPTSIAWRGQILSSSDVAGKMVVDLERLAFMGSQRYPVPSRSIEQPEPSDLVQAISRC